ncbi:MAG: phosphomethylpyrimidine synthase ThiC, partial [Candidatus Omnitrophica bacterium]|nr:phosphomethylpyrimidine synthase ThiC [Candidatus Omnitrophota bacterium]
MAQKPQPVTQLEFARSGVITDAMKRVAERERLDPELIRAEIARGRLIIPANIHHLAESLDPMGIGIVCSVKINANMGNSAVTSDIEEELKKLHMAVHYGSDTVMDLSTGGNIPEIRKALIAKSPVPLGTVPIYEAVTRVKRVEDLTPELLLAVITEQAEQGVDYMTIHAGIL